MSQLWIHRGIGQQLDKILMRFKGRLRHLHVLFRLCLITVMIDDQLLQLFFLTIFQFLIVKFGNQFIQHLIQLFLQLACRILLRKNLLKIVQ